MVTVANLGLDCVGIWLVTGQLITAGHGRINAFAKQLLLLNREQAKSSIWSCLKLLHSETTITPFMVLLVCYVQCMFDSAL